MRSSGRFPDFIIIGAMKSATSTLHKQLSTQPGVFMSTPKEPNFFSDDPIYKRGLDWYRGLFSAAEADAICGESSTHYTKLPDYPSTVPRLKVAIVKPKFIYVLRHPVDRLVSHYIHQWSEGVMSCDINHAIDRYPELINYSCYGMQIKPYLEAFGRDAVLPIFFDELKVRPDQALAKVGRFIGCEQPLSWRYDIEPDNVSRLRVRKFNGYRFLIESSLMRSFRRLLVPQIIRDHIKTGLQMHERPQINQYQLDRITSIFNDDLEVLHGWLPHSLSCQNFENTD